MCAVGYLIEFHNSRAANAIAEMSIQWIVDLYREGQHVGHMMRYLIIHVFVYQLGVFYFSYKGQQAFSPLRNKA